jgi:hypothetical protein
VRPFWWRVNGDRRWAVWWIVQGAWLAPPQTITSQHPPPLNKIKKL